MHYFQGSREHRPPPPWGTSMMEPLKIKVLMRFIANVLRAIYILTDKRNATIEFCQVIHMVHKHELHKLTITSTSSKASVCFLFIRHVG